MAGEAWEGSAANRLTGGWAWYERDLGRDWISESAPLAERASHAVRNDPVIAALKVAVITGTHGSTGLRFRSLAESPDGEPLPELRDQIEAAVAEASEGCNLDAAGLLSRRGMDEALEEMAFVRGEGFAIRTWAPGRPGSVTSTCWRVVGRDRIGNPPGMTDGPTLYQGFKLDSNGAVIGFWVKPSDPTKQAERRAWVFAPLYDDLGLPAAIHRVGNRPPGTYRGVSELAPILPISRQVKALLEAYVVAKRVQSCHPIFIACDDPAAAAKKDARGAVWGPNTVIEPGKVYYITPGAQVHFPSYSFQGTDLREFLDTLYRNEFAAVGFPIDVVLAQLGKTNMAASRSAWLQYYRQCERRQDDHIAQVCRPMDSAIIAEAVATGRIALPAGMTIKQACRGRYTRPPRSMPDPLKEAQAVQAWRDLGRDLTGMWSESAGIDFRESVEQRAEDDAWLAEFGVTSATAAPAITAEPEEPEGPEDDESEDDESEESNEESDDARTDPPPG